MSMNKVSVIIPAYNAEKTVEKTVRNVLASTIPVDVWVVDDGSTDGTGGLLDRLRLEVGVDNGRSRLFVVHQKNQGAYMARLNALRQIKTPWFGFVDADDTVEPEMFEKMLAFAEKENCDVVQCGVEGVGEEELGNWFVKLEERWRKEVEVERGGRVLGCREEIEQAFIKTHLERGEGSSFIWNKLYRNQYDFLKFVTFERLTNFDDMIFNFQFFEKVQRMGFLPDKLYHYAATEGSVTHSYGARQFNDFCACVHFRDARSVSRYPWYWINLRSGVISVLRSSLPVSKKFYWVVRLLGVCWF